MRWPTGRHYTDGLMFLINDQVDLGIISKDKRILEFQFLKKD